MEKMKKYEKLTNELADVLPFIIDGLHTTPSSHENYNVLGLSKRHYSGSFIIIADKRMTFQGTDYANNDRRFNELIDDIKEHYKQKITTM